MLWKFMTRFLSSLALHWNETAGNIEGTLADEDAAFQQSNSSSSKNNSHNSAFQKEIILPSRLVYYLNRDSESPYHILDTRTRYQQKHNKVRSSQKRIHCAVAKNSLSLKGDVLHLFSSLVIFQKSLFMGLKSVPVKNQGRILL